MKLRGKHSPTFSSVLIAVILGTALVVGAFIINARRPSSDTQRASGIHVRATGKCATCHRRETSAVVHQFEHSRHAASGVSCLDCHKVANGQEKRDHHGFEISKKLTSKNCAACHAAEYDQYLRSRHAAPAWAAVAGAKDFTKEQIAHCEKYHKGAVNRPPNALAILEGQAAIRSGCAKCHNVGKPNADGSIGSCTHCHSRHRSSIVLARLPETCGHCHMGPDHAQIEIYHESKHGVLFNAQKNQCNLNADPKKLTTNDMPVPTCATCHMSGLEGLNVTHDTSERLSYYLFSPISEKRDSFTRSQDAMKATCLKCHAKSGVEKYYKEAEAVLEHTNKHVAKAKKMIDSLRTEQLLSPMPFDEPLEFMYFDYWHYYGRTAKHGAFMGGADFVQWHGNYELLKLYSEMQKSADELRKSKMECGGE